MKYIFTLLLTLTLTQSYSQDIYSSYYDDGYSFRDTIVMTCDTIMLNMMVSQCMEYSLSSPASDYRCRKFAELNGACMIYKKVEAIDSTGVVVETTWYRLD